MELHYINQLNYPDVPYFTGTACGGLPQEMNNFAKTGCGVCCFLMGIEALTGKQVPIEEGIKLAVDSGATKHFGTDLDVLLQYATPLYGLSYELTDDIEVLKDRIAKGSVAIANTGGNRGDYICPFSPNGHYVYIINIKDDICTIFDTSYRKEKYASCLDDEITITDDKLIEVSVDYLDKACENKSPRYCIIKKD